MADLDISLRPQEREAAPGGEPSDEGKEHQDLQDRVAVWMPPSRDRLVMAVTG
jgi:hypothetical protein